jgi:hypothetical protein
MSLMAVSNVVMARSRSLELPIVQKQKAHARQGTARSRCARLPHRVSEFRDRECSTSTHLCFSHGIPFSILGSQFVPRGAKLEHEQRAGRRERARRRKRQSINPREETNESDEEESEERRAPGFSAFCFGLNAIVKLSVFVSTRYSLLQDHYRLFLEIQDAHCLGSTECRCLFRLDCPAGIVHYGGDIQDWSFQ